MRSARTSNRSTAMRSEFPLDADPARRRLSVRARRLGHHQREVSERPSKRSRDEIRAAGFKAGIWTAPFLAARDSRLMADHPDWFIMHEQTGEPVRAGHNPNWTTSDDKFAYALDPSNPAFRAHLRHLFEKLTRDFGYSYLETRFSLRRRRARPASRSKSHARRNDSPRPRGDSRRRRRRRVHPRMRLPAWAGGRRRGRNAHRARRFAVLGLDCVRQRATRPRFMRSTRSSRAASCIGGCG